MNTTTTNNMIYKKGDSFFPFYQTLQRKMAVVELAHVCGFGGGDVAQPFAPSQVEKRRRIEEQIQENIDKVLWNVQGPAVQVEVWTVDDANILEKFVKTDRKWRADTQKALYILKDCMEQPLWEELTVKYPKWSVEDNSDTLRNILKDLFERFGQYSASNDSASRIAIDNMPKFKNWESAEQGIAKFRMNCVEREQWGVQHEWGDLNKLFWLRTRLIDPSFETVRTTLDEGAEAIPPMTFDFGVTLVLRRCATLRERMREVKSETDQDVANYGAIDNRKRFGEGEGGNYSPYKRNQMSYSINGSRHQNIQDRGMYHQMSPNFRKRQSEQQPQGGRQNFPTKVCYKCGNEGHLQRHCQVTYNNNKVNSTTPVKESNFGNGQALVRKEFSKEEKFEFAKKKHMEAKQAQLVAAQAEYESEMLLSAAYCDFEEEDESGNNPHVEDETHWEDY
jgi:hypothetical protein